MHALLNSSHGTHRAIIIVRTVTGRRQKSPDRWPVGDRVPPRDRADQHRTCYITRTSVLCPLTSSLFKPTVTTLTAAAGGASWVASTPCHSYARVSVVSHQHRCAYCKSLIHVSPWSSTKDPCPQTKAIRNVESAVRRIRMLPSSHSTNLYDKMLTNCNIITASNDSVISCDNIQFNHSFLMSFTSHQKKILDKKIEGILSTSVCRF